MDMHRLRRLHDSQYIMKNPFTNENSNLSNIFHNNIHRKKVESLKVRSTEEFLCQFAWLPCRFFRGRRQGRQPLNIYIYISIWVCPETGYFQIPNPMVSHNFPVPFLGLYTISRPIIYVTLSIAVLLFIFHIFRFPKIGLPPVLIHL